MGDDVDVQSVWVREAAQAGIDSLASRVRQREVERRLPTFSESESGRVALRSVPDPDSCCRCTLTGELCRHCRCYRAGRPCSGCLPGQHSICRNLTCFEPSSAVASAASVQRAPMSSASGAARHASTATDHNLERAPPSGVASANTVHTSVHDAARQASAGKDHTTELVAHTADITSGIVHPRASSLR